MMKPILNTNSNNSLPNKKIIQTLSGISLIILSALSMAELPSPSFDCAKASTSIEKLICSDNELASLDAELSKKYRGGLDQASDKISYKQQQIEWLKSIRNACTNLDCLKTAYSTRIEELTPHIPEDNTQPKTSTVEDVQADVQAEDAADKNLEARTTLQEEQTASKLQTEDAIKKAEEDKAASASLAQAQKAAIDEALAVQAKQLADKAASDQKNFWDSIKAGGGLIAIIAAIIYALIQRQRKKKSTQSDFAKSLDLNKSITSIVRGDTSKNQSELKRTDDLSTTSSIKNLESESPNKISQLAQETIAESPHQTTSDECDHKEQGTINDATNESNIETTKKSFPRSWSALSTKQKIIFITAVALLGLGLQIAGLLISLIVIVVISAIAFKLTNRIVGLSITVLVCFISYATLTTYKEGTQLKEDEHEHEHEHEHEIVIVPEPKPQIDQAKRLWLARSRIHKNMECNGFYNNGFYDALEQVQSMQDELKNYPRVNFNEVGVNIVESYIQAAKLNGCSD